MYANYAAIAATMRSLARAKNVEVAATCTRRYIFRLQQFQCTLEYVCGAFFFVSEYWELRNAQIP